MENKVFTINKGINKPLEFKGLKAQYIAHLAGSVIGVFFVYAVLYIAGVNAFIAVPFAFGFGGYLIARVFRMSKKYGQFGLMKRGARKNVPAALYSRNRKIFTQLFSDHVRAVR